MRTDMQGKRQFRLTYADIDAAQFVFANYYSWMERAFTELMTVCGNPRRMATNDRCGFSALERCWALHITSASMG